MEQRLKIDYKTYCRDGRLDVVEVKNCVLKNGADIDDVGATKLLIQIAGKEQKISEKKFVDVMMKYIVSGWSAFAELPSEIFIPIYEPPPTKPTLINPSSSNATPVNQTPSPKPASINPLSTTAMPVDVPMIFLPNPLDKFTLSASDEGKEFSIDIPKYKSRSFFLKHPITEGVFRWSVKARYIKNTFFKKDSFIYLGVSTPKLLAELHEESLGSKVGSCAFEYGAYDNGGTNVFRMLNGSDDLIRSDFVVPDGSVVSLELDMSAGTLSLFKGNEKFPKVFSGIAGPVHLGITAEGTVSFTSLSLLRLSSPTAPTARSPLKCAYVHWKPVYTAPPPVNQPPLPVATSVTTPADMSMIFLPNPLDDYKLSASDEGKEFSMDLPKYGGRTFFLNHCIKEGVFRWSVKARYNKGTFFKKDSFICIGIATPGLLSQLHSSALGSEMGSCAFQYGAYDNGETTVFRLRNGTDFPSNESYVIADGSVVSVELDMFTGTLSFFRGVSRIPKVFSGITGLVHLGITGEGTVSFTSLSLRRLASPTTASSSECSYVPWRPWTDNPSEKG